MKMGNDWRAYPSLLFGLVKMSYKLFLDDIRDVERVFSHTDTSCFITVRSYDKFLGCISKNGLPEFISFDNDLGVDKNGEVTLDGYAACKWLVYESGLNLINLRYNVHSANPVAAKQIAGLLDGYIRFLKNENGALKR